MSVTITGIKGREVLDSRGRPTVEASVSLSDETTSFASVPAGESKSSHEALELRDGDHSRYRARGVRKAVDNISAIIAPALIGCDAIDQRGIDNVLVELDGTQAKTNLGANALLAVSIAVARAAAASVRVPLWRYLGGADARVLPLPMVNIISGGLHARGNLDFQDFLAIPVGAQSYSEALEMSVALYAAMGDILNERGLPTLKADEGGFGPPLANNRTALELLLEGVERAGYKPRDDIAFGIDVAASHFYDVRESLYELASESRMCTSQELVETIASLVESYPIVSVEDGLAEDDWEGWEYLTSLLGDRVQLVGDDLFATNVTRLERGIECGAGNAILVKMNQIGTLSETIAVVRRAHDASFRPIISARSGDTEDSAIADLAVATNAGQIKVGSVAQSERLAKYNQLLRIEETLGTRAVFDPAQQLGPPAPVVEEPLL
jgi:enolase